MSFSFCRIHGSPLPWIISAWTLRPGFVRSVRMCSHTHQITGNISRPCQFLMSMGISPTLSSGHQHLVGRREVHGDLGAAVAGAHQQHGAGRELAGLR